MKKKFLALILSALMILSLAACGGNEDTAEEPADDAGTEEPAGDGQTYTVGILQQMQHVALDEATQGFQDALTELLGESVTIDPQNASGDSANCATIANNFVSQGVDLIMANGTTALQAAAWPPPATIPILGTSITEYGVALGIDGFSGTTGIQRLGHLRPGAPGPAGGHAAGVVPRGPDRGPAVLLRRAQQPVPGGHRPEATWRRRASPAPSTPSPTPTTCPPWPPPPVRGAATWCTSPPTTPAANNAELIGNISLDSRDPHHRRRGGHLLAAAAWPP